MRLTNTSHSYGLPSRSLHWLMVPLVWGLFGLGLYMTGLDYYHSWYHAAPWWHKSFGMLAMLLLLLRLGWLLIQGKPDPLPNHKPWEVRLAHITHTLLYLLLIMSGISGYFIATLKGQGIAFFDWFEVPALTDQLQDPKNLLGKLHLWGSVVLVALSVVHALAALKHHFIDRDSTLTRMIR